MTSMYETIMQLPLFKGIGEDQLSQILEKTSLEFLKYEEGEKIFEPGQQVTTIDFIITGRVEQKYSLREYPLSVIETLGAGNVMGVLNLYGMETHYISTSRAIGRVNVMRMEKSQYMNILSSDRIFIMNFANYLSAAAQKIPTMVLDSGVHSVWRELTSLVTPFVSRHSETIKIEGTDEAIALYCGVSMEEFQKWKINETNDKRIKGETTGIILKGPGLL